MDLCLRAFAKNGNTIAQHVAALAAMLQVVSSGMLQGWISVALPELVRSEQNQGFISFEDGSWLAILPLLGSLCASLFPNFLTKICGRKLILQLTAILFIVSWIFVTLGGDINLLILGRFIGGVSNSFVFIVGPMYVAEIASPLIRGRLATLISLFFIIGLLLIYTVGYFLNMYYAGLIAIISPVVSLILLIFVPESPYGLILKNQPQKAKTCLKIFRGKDNVDEEFNKIEQAVQVQIVESKGHLIDLFSSSSNLKSVFILLLVNASRQLSGIVAVTFYLTAILEYSGLNIPASHGTIYFFVLQLLATLPSLFLVDTKGRKFLLLLSCYGCFISLLLGGFYYQFFSSDFPSRLIQLIPVIVIIFYTIFYSIGLQSVPILLVAETFPTNLNAWGLSLNEVYNDITGLIVSKLFPVVHEAFGIRTVFFIFSFCCIVSVTLIKMVVPETKKMSLEEIQEVLKKEKCDGNNSEVV